MTKQQELHRQIDTLNDLQAEAVLLLCASLENEPDESGNLVELPVVNPINQLM